MQILDNDQAWPRRLYWAQNAQPLMNRRIGSVTQGSFIMCPASLAPLNPMLHTGGAGPCIIVAMCNTAGDGALAHVAATNQEDGLLAAVGHILAAFGNRHPQHILLTAGSAFDAAARQRVTEAIAQQANVPVEWRVLNPDNPADVYSQAILFPATGYLLLFDDFNGPADVNLSCFRCPDMQYLPALQE